MDSNFWFRTKTIVVIMGPVIAYTGQRIAARGLASALDFEAIPRGKHVPNDYIVNPFFKE